MVSLTWATHTVTDEESASDVMASLLMCAGPVALDTETLDCNPKKESPVQLARLWCMTLAWRTPTGIEAAFVPAQWVHLFKTWLECDAFPKVGQNVYGFDRHVFANAGIDLRGIYADTQRMSRLLNPAKVGVHGLKAMAALLGIPMLSFDDVTEQVPLDIAWADESKRPAIQGYAVRDAVATLQVFENLSSTLSEVRW